MNKYNIYMVAFDGVKLNAKVWIEETSAEDSERIIEDLNKGHHPNQLNIENLAVVLKGFYPKKFISIAFMKESAQINSK